MHPAFSVIFFTTASGAGYGLLALLCLLGAAGLLPAERWFGIAAFGLAFALVTAGLLSSTFHLGHPERAWRALSQWRSSWLSREGVMAVATYLPTGLFATGWVFFGRTDGPFAWLGFAGALLCVATVYCTAMIYASLKSVPRWSNPWVAPVYLALALATGALLLALLVRLFGHEPGLTGPLALLSLFVAAAAKSAYWRSIGNRPARSTTSSATGLGNPGRVRLLDAPHTEANYLMQEMGHKIARKHAGRLRFIALALLFAVPIVLLLAAVAIAGNAGPTILIGLAVLSAGAGVLVERWLFFAEAKHVVALYYGESTA